MHKRSPPHLERHPRCQMTKPHAHPALPALPMGRSFGVHATQAAFPGKRPDQTKGEGTRKYQTRAPESAGRGAFCRTR